MRIEKKIKKYADSKMEQFKDTEFLNSICDEHFNIQSKPKYHMRAAMSAVAGFVILIGIILSISLMVRHTTQHYTAQYITTPSNIHELNEHCKYFIFVENEPYSVSLTTNRDTKETAYYNAEYLLNNGADSFLFLITVNDNTDVEFNEYEKFKQYGNSTINYTIINEYDENNNIRSSSVFGNILTNCEKIKIKHIGIRTDDETFFAMLSKLLIAKE